MKGPLKIMLWGEEIGRLAWDSRTRNTYFTYHPEFLKKKLDIAPLTAPISRAKGQLPFWGDKDRKYRSLPPFLSDSLPDDWGNQLFERWRIEHKLANAEITPLEKLSFIGRRGMGALEFVPSIPLASDEERIDIQSLIDLAGRIFREREQVQILPEESLTEQALIVVGTSAGGRQPKAVLAINRTTGEIRSGQIAGLKDYDYCILKFGDPARSSAELEMVYYTMCLQAGIKMMESRLFEVEGHLHFLTRRFDRCDDGKQHAQTLAALYPGIDSYEGLLEVCRKLRLPEGASEEIFRRMVFNVLANNTDDHDRNFSFLMDKTGCWQLAPAYDMTFIFNQGGFQPQEERCLMVRGKRMEISKEDILAFARDNGIRRADIIISQVAKALLSFRELATRYGVKEEWANRVDGFLSSQLTAWGYIKTGVEGSSESYPEQMELVGHVVSHARLEQAYRGNYHLLAAIDGKEHKYIFRMGTPEYESIARKGGVNISNEELRELVTSFLIPKIDRS